MFTNVNKNALLMAGYCLVLGWVSLDALQALVRVARHDETASHVLLVPFISGFLMYQQRHAIFSCVRVDRMVGIPLIVAGTVLLWMTNASEPVYVQNTDALSAAVSAFVILVVAGFSFCYGRHALREAIFPLAFLIFLIPIPQSALDAAVLFLKTGSTETVALLFSATGTPHHREGFLFTLPEFTIEIADECSGIRSSIALLITAVLGAQMFLRDAWSRTLFVIAVLPIALLKNGIRIVSLSLLAMHVNPGFLTGQLHQDGGIVFFVLSLAILAPVLGALRRLEMYPPHLLRRDYI